MFKRVVSQAAQTLNPALQQALKNAPPAAAKAAGKASAAGQAAKPSAGPPLQLGNPAQNPYQESALKMRSRSPAGSGGPARGFHTIASQSVLGSRASSLPPPGSRGIVMLVQAYKADNPGKPTGFESLTPKGLPMPTLDGQGPEARHMQTKESASLVAGIIPNELSSEQEARLMDTGARESHFDAVLDDVFSSTETAASTHKTIGQLDTALSSTSSIVAEIDSPAAKATMEALEAKFGALDEAREDISSMPNTDKFATLGDAMTARNVAGYLETISREYDAKPDPTQKETEDFEKAASGLKDILAAHDDLPKPQKAALAAWLATGGSELQTSKDADWGGDNTPGLKRHAGFYGLVNQVGQSHNPKSGMTTDQKVQNFSLPFYLNSALAHLTDADTNGKWQDVQKAAPDDLPKFEQNEDGSATTERHLDIYSVADLNRLQNTEEGDSVETHNRPQATTTDSVHPFNAEKQPDVKLVTTSKNSVFLQPFANANQNEATIPAVFSQYATGVEKEATPTYMGRDEMTVIHVTDDTATARAVLEAAGK